MMRSFFILCIFLIFAALLTLPLLLHLDTALDSDADTLMFVSVLHSFRTNVTAHPRDLFSAPFYHPHRRTLLTVFHNYMVGLAYIPVYEITKHPVRAYNILYILTIALNGFAMYCLVRYLTGEELPGVIAGFIFAFCPFRVANFQYIPFLTNYWIVFSFLLLFRFLELLSRGQAPRIMLFAWSLIFYLLQCMSDIVAGLYFGIAFFPVLIYGLYTNRRQLRHGPLAKVITLLALLAVCLATATAPLRSIRKDMVEERVAWNIETVQEICPSISSYFSSPPGNIFYGNASRGYSMNARQLNFYGVTAWLLAIVGFFSARKVAHFFPRQMIWLFFFICLIAFLLSLGPWIYLTPSTKLCPGPYMLIYRFCPVLRTLGGLGMVILLGVCIMAGFGVKWLADQLQKSHLCRRGIIGAGLLAVLTMEYASYPPTTWGQPFFLTPRDPPAVYRWLMAQADNDPLIELPMPWEPEEVGGAFGLDTAAMYWSLFHGRRIVNGQTAFSYPEYKIIVDQMKLFPSRETIDILRALGVRYVVIHVGRLPKLDWQKELVRRHPESGYDWRGTIERLNRFGGELALREKEGGDRLYEILPPAEGRPATGAGAGRFLDRQGWTATASHREADAKLAIDGREDTEWFCWQRAGEFFQVDMGIVQEITGIGMLLRYVNGCPKNPRIEVSEDGKNWKGVSYEGAYLDFIRRLLQNPQERLFRIALPPVRARYIRITSTRFEGIYPWSITELDVYAPVDGCRRRRAGERGGASGERGG